MIKVVSLDMDGTLVSENVDDFIWNEEIPRLYAEKHNLSLEEAKKEVYAEYYKQRYIDKVKEWTSIEYWLRFYNISFDEVYEHLSNETKVFEEVLEVLDYLKNKYDLIVVTSAYEDFMNVKLNLQGLKSYFKKTYTSKDTSTGKKDHFLFRKVLEDFNIINKEIIHVGDKHYYDKEVPESLGIKSYLLDREGKGDLKSLKELKNIL